MKHRQTASTFVARTQKNNFFSLNMTLTRIAGVVTTATLLAVTALPLTTLASETNATHPGRTIPTKHVIVNLNRHKAKKAEKTEAGEKKTDANEKTEKTEVGEKKAHAPKQNMTSGTVVSISGTDINLKLANGTTMTIHTTGAKFVRHFGAAMTLADVQTNDHLLVKGTVTGSEVAATVIRDQSLQAKNGTFVGTISTISAADHTFALQSKARGMQQIMVTDTTKYTLKGKAASMSDLAAGQTVRVSGVWDRTNSNVTAKRVEIKK
jgi:hypothetical protein